MKNDCVWVGSYDIVQEVYDISTLGEVRAFDLDRLSKGLPGSIILAQGTHEEVLRKVDKAKAHFGRPSLNLEAIAREK